MIRRFLVSLMLVFACTLPASAILVFSDSSGAIAPADETDRFAGTTPGTVANSNLLTSLTNSSNFDFSGVGRGGGWATMISPTVFLASSHSHPSVGSSVSFFDDTGAILASPSVQSGASVVVGGATTEVWVGVLANAVPASVKIYDIATANMGDHVLNVGRGGAGDFRIGANRVEAMFNNFTPGNGVVGTSDFAVYYDDTAAGDLTGGNASTGNSVNYESYFQGGDSGGPSFVDSGSGNLKLVGIHSFKGKFSTDADAKDFERRGSGDVFLGPYLSQINSSVAVQAVPEPSAFLFLAFVSLGLTLTRRIQGASGQV